MKYAAHMCDADGVTDIAIGALVVSSCFDYLAFFLGNDSNDFLFDYLTFFERLIALHTKFCPFKFRCHCAE